eukprot:symbB.v1.2.036248.t1/scaffold5073.1/size33253/2
MQNVTDPGFDNAPGKSLLSKVGSLNGGKDPLKWQIDTGEGFLRDAPDDAMGDMMGSGMALAKGLMSKNKSKKKGGALALLKGPGEPPKVDLAAYEMQKQLRVTLDFARRAVLTAAQLEESIGKASAAANDTVGKTAEFLNLPGFPPEALRRPPAPKGFGGRPSDMAPAFLDFLYQTPWKERVAAGPNSILSLADPYSQPGGPSGREVHDFFGSPPLPTEDTGEKCLGRRMYTCALGMSGIRANSYVNLAPSTSRVGSEALSEKKDASLEIFLRSMEKKPKLFEHLVELKRAEMEAPKIQICVEAPPNDVFMPLNELRRSVCDKLCGWSNGNNGCRSRLGESILKLLPNQWPMPEKGGLRWAVQKTETILQLAGKLVLNAASFSVPEARHGFPLQSAGVYVLLSTMNHSCSPSVRLDTCAESGAEALQVRDNALFGTPTSAFVPGQLDHNHTGRGWGPLNLGVRCSGLAIARKTTKVEPLVLQMRMPSMRR